MRLLLLAGTTLSALSVVMSVPVAAQERFDTFCVRVSEPVQAVNLNALVVRKRVTVDVIPLSECAPTSSSPASADGTLFTIFVDHLTGATGEVGELYDAIGAAGNDFDLDAMESSLRQLEALADRELSWLDTHPPLACYQVSHNDWRGMMVALKTAATTSRRGVTNIDGDLLEQGAAQMDNVNALTREAGDRLGTISC